MKRKMKQLAGILLSFVMVLGLMPGMSLTAYAATDTYTTLKNNATVVKFNNHDWYIIADDSTATGGTVTLLAADTSFGTSAFDSTSPYSNAYSSSTVKGVLDALTAEDGAFASVKDAIADTDLSDVGVTGAKLYLLSTSEAAPYKDFYFSGAQYGGWWLRSPGHNDNLAVFVSGLDGDVDGYGNYVNRQFGVRPALKLDLSKVTFDSESKTFSVGEAAASPYANLKNTTTIVHFDDKEWYLINYDSSTVTLLSKECVAASMYDSNGQSNTYSGSTVETAVNNYYTNSISDNVKSAIVDSKMFLLTTDQANTIYQVNSEVLKCNEASGAYDNVWWLCSPGNLDYYAACVVGDFGSVDAYGFNVYRTFGVRPALKLNLSSVIFSSESKTFTVGSYSVTVTAGSNMTKTETSGKASQTGLSGAMTDVVYTANEGYYFPENYSVTAVNGISVTRNSYTQITVSGTPSADAEITLTAPTAKTTPDAPTAAATDCTTADNNDGKLTGVTTAMEYKKSDAADWTAGTGSDITGLVPGTYYVRVKATETTNASTNQELTIKGFISYTVTFKVVNGKWNEGEGDAATADKTVTLTGHDGDTLKLTADQIPAVGTKPNDTYKAGSWDTTPSAEIAITGATTYTYTYAQKESISQTVTFKVANGKWNDETTVDKTVTLTGYEGDTLKLAANQIPAVGTKPNTNYKAGSWDVTPSPETEITGATTYTYTYVAKEASVVTKAPEAKILTYNGQAQELVTAGTATGGTMQYALGNATEATQPYTTSIPSKTDAGTYYVWYKVKGDDNHNDTDANYVEASIGKRSVKLTSDTDSKVYDGTALTNNNITAGGDGFATGEGATYDVTGSQTQAGESANTFTYTLNEGTSADNYEITKTEGTLSVTKAAQDKPKENFTTTKASNEVKADGTISGFDVAKAYQYSADGGKTWTDVSGKTVKVKKGTYQIRYAPDENHEAGVFITVMVEAEPVAQTTQVQADELALNAGLIVTQKGSKVKVKWGKVKGADGYEIYMEYCSKTKFGSKPEASLKANKTSATLKTLNGKKLNLKKNFKLYVRAYKKVNGKKVTLANSIAAHVVGRKNKQNTNAKSITIEQPKVVLSVGATHVIKAKTNLVDKKKKQLGNSHAAEFRYASSNQNIASVDAKGTVTAKRKGTCIIYVYSRNGLAKTVTVTVQ